MGLFSKSIIILLIAIGTPLVYRSFVDDKSVAYLNKHITNYKVVDQFLRQSAKSIDNAKDYLNEDSIKKIVKKVEPIIEQVRPHYEKAVETVSRYLNKLNKVSEKPSDEQKQSGKDHKVGKKHKLVKCPTEKDKEVRLWSKSELENQIEGKIFLAFLGKVYDVSSAASTFYGPGKDYSMFSNKDATRAYITGNFTHDLNDDISDLDKSSYSALQSWISFYAKSYPYVGKLEGRYYNSNGCPTAATEKVYKVLAELERDSEKKKNENIVLPECNSEWNGDTKKSRVWCSKASGGVERSWVGVPRLYTDESGTNRCVCYSDESNVTPEMLKNLKNYKNCESNSFECNL